MDMFNVKERNNPSMKDHIDIKKPAFGGPSTAEPFDKSTRKTLQGYQRVIDRNADFEGGNFNHNYDPTWKAVTRDLISRTAKKKPFDPMYAKPTIATTDAVEEAARIRTFEEFVNENEGFNMFAEAEKEPMDDMPADDAPIEDEPVIDEEKLEALMEEFGDDVKDLIEDIAEKMEIEKEEVCDLLCAAVKKIVETPEEEEDEEDEEENKDEENKDEE